MRQTPPVISNFPAPRPASTAHRGSMTIDDHSTRTGTDGSAHRQFAARHRRVRRSPAASAPSFGTPAPRLDSPCSTATRDSRHGFAAEGFAVCAPSLPGCWSQGATREEAVENISIAIREYLETEEQPPDGSRVANHPTPGDSPALAEAAEVREIELMN